MSACPHPRNLFNRNMSLVGSVPGAGYNFNTIHRSGPRQRKKCPHMRTSTEFLLFEGFACRRGMRFLASILHTQLQKRESIKAIVALGRNLWVPSAERICRQNSCDLDRPISAGSMSQHKGNYRKGDAREGGSHPSREFKYFVCFHVHCDFYSNSVLHIKPFFSIHR